MLDDPDDLAARVGAIEVVMSHLLTELLPGVVLADNRDHILKMMREREVLDNGNIVPLNSEKLVSIQTYTAIAKLYNVALSVQWDQALEGKNPKRIEGLSEDRLHPAD